MVSFLVLTSIALSISGERYVVNSATDLTAYFNEIRRLIPNGGVIVLTMHYRHQELFFAKNLTSRGLPSSRFRLLVLNMAGRQLQRYADQLSNSYLVAPYFSVDPGEVSDMYLYGI